MCGARRRLPFAARRSRHSSFALDPKPLAHTDPLSPGAPQRHGFGSPRTNGSGSVLDLFRAAIHLRPTRVPGLPRARWQRGLPGSGLEICGALLALGERARFRFPPTTPAAIVFEASSCGANLSAQRFPSATTSLDSETAQDARLSVQLVWGALVCRVEAANPRADGPFVATPDQWPTTIRVLARHSLLLVAAALICSDLTAGISPYCIRAWKG